TTVSRTYAAQIQSAAQGAGLEGVLKNREADLVGIVNGIDYSAWNPATDPGLVARYDAHDPVNKGRNKTAMLRELGLELEPDGVSRRPLVAYVGRLVHQKGADLLPALLGKISRQDACMVVVGDGDDAIGSALEEAAAKDRERTAFVRAAPEAFVHRLFAAADI